MLQSSVNGIFELQVLWFINNDWFSLRISVNINNFLTTDEAGRLQVGGDTAMDCFWDQRSVSNDLFNFCFTNSNNKYVNLE